MAETVEKTVGKLIVKRREELGYSRKDLSQKSGTSLITLRKWEAGTGGKMKLKHATAIEKALEWGAGYIYDLYYNHDPNNKTTAYRRFRLINDMTIREAAKRLGVCEDTMLSWELEKSEPTGFMIMAMSKLYKTTPNDLLDFGNYEAVYGS